MKKKKTYIVSQIKWDTDGAKVKLPKTLKVTIPNDITDIDDIDEYISDEISNRTGFCHTGFVTDKDK